jgi:hypothetical protein
MKAHSATIVEIEIEPAAARSDERDVNADMVSLDFWAADGCPYGEMVSVPRQRQAASARGPS